MTLACRIAALFSACSLLLPQAASSQDFSSIGSDLSELENLIHDTLENSRAQVTQRCLAPFCRPK
jgi:hypothetical protein